MKILCHGTMGWLKLWGVMWVLVGFIAVALAFWLGWAWWQAALVAVTLLSLALTALDWNVAFAGVIVNLVILLWLWLGPRLMAVLAPS